LKQNSSIKSAGNAKISTESTYEYLYA